MLIGFSLPLNAVHTKQSHCLCHCNYWWFVQLVGQNTCSIEIKLLLLFLIWKLMSRDKLWRAPDPKDHIGYWLAPQILQEQTCYMRHKTFSLWMGYKKHIIFKLHGKLLTSERERLYDWALEAPLLQKMNVSENVFIIIVIFCRLN